MTSSGNSADISVDIDVAVLVGVISRRRRLLCAYSASARRTILFDLLVVIEIVIRVVVVYECNGLPWLAEGDRLVVCEYKSRGHSD